MNNSTNLRLRASDLPAIIKSDSRLRHTVHTAVQVYVFALMISGYPKTLTAMATHFGIGIGRLSRLLNHPLLGAELDIALNRRTRKIIAGYLRSHDDVSIDLIIDATVIERSSRKAENVGLYHSNGKKVWGHRITNVGLLLDNDVYVPLAVIPHKTRSYARKCGLPYLTEGQMVCSWLQGNIGPLAAFTDSLCGKPTKLMVLLDAGYDNARIQKMIIDAGANFVMMMKCTRLVNGVQVKNYFRRNRCISWAGIRLSKVVNGITKRRKFRIRFAQNVSIARVGSVNVVCSEKSSGSCNKKTRRFIVSSDLSLTGREIVERYSRRWAIETWHKDAKQNYGIGDCSCSSFRAVENHIKLCLIAYCMHLEDLKCLPNKGIRLEDYMEYSVRKESRCTTTKIFGREKLDDEIRYRGEHVFAKVA